MTAQRKPTDFGAVKARASDAQRVASLASRVLSPATNQDRSDARAAAKARRELQAGTFDGVSLADLEASIAQGD